MNFFINICILASRRLNFVQLKFLGSEDASSEEDIIEKKAYIEKNIKIFLIINHWCIILMH